jgi:hypothetical protein
MYKMYVIRYHNSDTVKYIGDEKYGKAYWKSGRMMYDGFYKDGLKHGKGVEYWISGIVNYDGYWLENKRHGYGKLFYDTGELWYDGKWDKHMYNGYGKEYNLDGSMRYDGEWLNDKMNGKGVFFINKMIRYEGDMKDGKMCGNGKLLDNIENIILYDGGFEDNKKCGYGIEYNRDGVTIYIGNFEDNERKGKGTEYITEYKVKEYNENSILIYEGDVFNGEKNGKGKYTCMLTNTEYDGEWKDNKRHGKGVVKDLYKNYIIYEGEFVNDKQYNGRWYSSKNRLSYEGIIDKDGISYISYRRNKRLADAYIYDNSHTIIYKGEYNIHTKKREGKGNVFASNKMPDHVRIRYSGMFENDMYHGEGTKYNEYGLVCYKGTFVNGEISHGKEYDACKIIYTGSFVNGIRHDGEERIYKGKKVEKVAYIHEKRMKEKEETRIRVAKRKRAENDVNVPDEYKCPISMELMVDPVVCSDGHTYERESIEKLFRTNKYKSPLTREKITKALIPNVNLKKLINDYVEKMEI